MFSKLFGGDNPPKQSNPYAQNLVNVACIGLSNKLTSRQLKDLSNILEIASKGEGDISCMIFSDDNKQRLQLNFVDSKLTVNKLINIEGE